MPTSVRLDKRTEKTLTRLARQKSRTKSEIIRDAIESYAEREHKSGQQGSAYETIQDLVGCVSGGPKDLSLDTGQKFGEALRKGLKKSS
jgi:hypothetical protein